ncbi:discoidin domain-containing protein [Carboxylicivirga sp. A043]|uniref:discoidin domain-containing protein n=1 Tax=Carboxylicivirga litoralis TaxID=2816963 RepID=UPI0021CB4D64|nr:discoidin domain-containing protein [Carboxylicivirga sp. A043]MCU4157760.1 discoidin domain-containing protein [Carboxylicivirga sp. A043]
MKLLFFITVLFFITSTAYSQMVDAETPENVQPANDVIGGQWDLNFSDEFNGSVVNTVKWNIDNSTKSRAARPGIGIYDWRWKPENVSVENGNLILKVYKTNSTSMTNGSIQSHTKYTTQYGYFEARIKVGDAAKGTHTAFWLQGPNMSNVDGTANDGAEIDIFETAWTGDYTKSVVHIDGYGDDHQASTKKYDTPGIHDGFHTWGFHWTEYFMDIYYDGVFKVRYSDPKWVVQSPEFLWLSNGASFGLTGDQYFKDLPVGFLTQTEVDYIRVWKDVTPADERLLNKDSWALVSTNSEDTYGNNLASYAIDGNPITFWHSAWKENHIPHPHEIQIDLGKTANCSGFSYLPRQDQNPNGNVAKYELFISKDTDSWGEPVASGTFDAESNKKNVEFPNTVFGRYIKFVALSEVNNNSLTNAAEIDIMGEYAEEQVGIHDELKMVKVSAYPNPFRGQLKLAWEQSNEFNLCHIYSMDGRLINEQKVELGTNQLLLNIAMLKRGNYVIELIGKEVRAIKQVSKL